MSRILMTMAALAAVLVLAAAPAAANTVEATPAAVEAPAGGQCFAAAPQCGAPAQDAVETLLAQNQGTTCKDNCAEDKRNCDALCPTAAGADREDCLDDCQEEYNICESGC